VCAATAKETEKNCTQGVTDSAVPIFQTDKEHKTQPEGFRLGVPKF